jgi:hypothetical protein
MRSMQRLGFLAAVGLLAALPAVSQVSMSMRPPEFRGIFNPVMGSGAAYEMTNNSGKTELELTIVGKEEVNGKPGVWLEMGASLPQGGEAYVKNLLVIEGKSATSSRVVIQMAGQGPVDVTAMFANQQVPPIATDSRDAADHLGTEDVTTPAGTFNCEHYKAKDGAWETWISPKVTPWGMVKLVNSSDVTMVLTKVITGATDHIVGNPVPMNTGAGRSGAGSGQSAPSLGQAPPKN